MAATEPHWQHIHTSLAGQKAGLSWKACQGRKGGMWEIRQSAIVVDLI